MLQDIADVRDTWIARHSEPDPDWEQDVPMFDDVVVPSNVCVCGKTINSPDALIHGICNECWQYDTNLEIN